jgi:hypothetical protein
MSTQPSSNIGCKRNRPGSVATLHTSESLAAAHGPPHMQNPPIKVIALQGQNLSDSKSGSRHEPHHCSRCLIDSLGSGNHCRHVQLGL